MNIGILKCDQIREPLMAEHGKYPEMYATLFQSVDSSINFTVFDAEHGELPTDIHAADAYLITGSHHGVNDGFPWIEQLEDFVRTLHAAQKKVVGICFGHQLIAKALGGKVMKSPKGWGIGMSQNEIFQHKQWMSPSQKQFNLLVSHQDQVVELPPEAEVLAGSDFCPNYMMQIGSNLFTIQGHPEFTKEYTRDLMMLRKDIHQEQEIARGLQSLELTEDDALIAQWIVQFLKAA